MKRSVLVLLGLVAGSIIGMAAPDNDTTSYSLIIWYRAMPEHSAAFLEHLSTTGRNRFNGWKDAGRFADYQMLYASAGNFTSWDAMLILTFDRVSDMEGWMEIERTHPGGLDATELGYGQPYQTYLCERGFSAQGNGKSISSGESVFMVKPYGYPDAAFYRQYARAYLVPQFNAWINAGVLRSYGLYQNLTQAGESLEIYILLEYRSAEAVGKRDLVKKSIVAELSTDSGWGAINELKTLMRASDEERVVARQIAP